MLTLKIRDENIEFSFTSYFTKKNIHAEAFTLDDSEQIALDLLKMIKEKRKEDAQKDRDESSQSPKKRCF